MCAKHLDNLLIVKIVLIVNVPTMGLRFRLRLAKRFQEHVFYSIKLGLYDSSKYTCTDAGPDQKSSLKCTDIGLSNGVCTAITTEN